MRDARASKFASLHDHHPFLTITGLRPARGRAPADVSGPSREIDQSPISCEKGTRKWISRPNPACLGLELGKHGQLWMIRYPSIQRIWLFDTMARRGTSG